MYECGACKKPIEPGEPIVTVHDGIVGHNGDEVDYQNTDHYHALECSPDTA